MSKGTERRTKNMKNIEETIKDLKQQYNFNRYQNEYWLKQSEKEKELGLKKASKESEEIAQSYNERNVAVARTYAFINEITVMDAMSELFNQYSEMKVGISF